MKVLSDKQQQLMMKVQKNQEVQQELRKKQEELLHELNREILDTREPGAKSCH